MNYFFILSWFFSFFGYTEQESIEHKADMKTQQVYILHNLWYLLLDTPFFAVLPMTY